jgi:hypothetical protein
METLIDTICWIIIAYSVANALVKYFAMKETVQEIKEQLDKKIRVVKLETEKDLLLAYDEENGQFLGQGTSKDEVKKNLIERFPHKIFLLDESPFSAEPLPNIKVINVDTTNTR